MEQDIQRKVIITESGEQIPIQMPGNATGGVIIPGDGVKGEVVLDVTEEQFIAIQEQAITNDIPTDVLN